MYERGGELVGYNDYDMEARLRYDAGPRRRALSARPPEFFQTLPTLAPSARGLQGAPGAYHGAAAPNVRPRPHSHEPQPRQASNSPPSFPREVQQPPRIRSLSRDFPAVRQGISVGQVQGNSNALAGPSRSAIPPGPPSRSVEQHKYSQGSSFLRLAQSMRQEREQGVTYYKRDGAVGCSNDAYSIAQEAKVNKHRYGN